LLHSISYSGGVPEILGLRERKKYERRQRIERVAIDLFERNGFDAISIEQIAAAADIAPRTFFSYFETKEDVVLSDYAHRLQRIRDTLRDRPQREPAWAALQASFAAVAADYEEASAQLLRRFRIIASSPSVAARSLHIQAGWEASLADDLRVRLDAPPNEPEPSLLAAAALAVMRASIQQWLSDVHATPLPVLVQAGFARLGRGLLPRRR